MHQYFERMVEKGERPGVITMVVRSGRIADWQTFGLRDVEKKLPMEKDSLFLIYSMTKPVTSVAVMMLVEEGKLTLDAAVSKYIPELAKMQVYASGTAERTSMVAARPMTVRQLLTHISRCRKRRSRGGRRST